MMRKNFMGFPLIILNAVLFSCHGEIISLDWQAGHDGGVTAAKNCDYAPSLFDNLELKVLSLEMCGERCLALRDCTHFRWSSFGHFCWLKKGRGDWRQRAVTSTNGVCGYVNEDQKTIQWHKVLESYVQEGCEIRLLSFSSVGQEENYPLGSLLGLIPATIFYAQLIERKNQQLLRLHSDTMSDEQLQSLITAFLPQYGRRPLKSFSECRLHILNAPNLADLVLLSKLSNSIRVWSRRLKAHVFSENEWKDQTYRSQGSDYYEMETHRRNDGEWVGLVLIPNFLAFLIGGIQNLKPSVHLFYDMYNIQHAVVLTVEKGAVKEAKYLCRPCHHDNFVAPPWYIDVAPAKHLHFLKLKETIVRHSQDYRFPSQFSRAVHWQSTSKSQIVLMALNPSTNPPSLDDLLAAILFARFNLTGHPSAQQTSVTFSFDFVQLSALQSQGGFHLHPGFSHLAMTLSEARALTCSPVSSGRALSWFVYFVPFDKGTWIALMGSLLLISLIALKTQGDPISVFLKYFAALMETYCGGLNNSGLFVTTTLTLLVLSNTYKCYVTTSLTAPLILDAPTSVHQMTSNNFRFFFVGKSDWQNRQTGRMFSSHWLKGSFAQDVVQFAKANGVPLPKIADDYNSLLKTLFSYRSSCYPPLAWRKAAVAFDTESWCPGVGQAAARHGWPEALVRKLSSSVEDSTPLYIFAATWPTTEISRVLECQSAALLIDPRDERTVSSKIGRYSQVTRRPFGVLPLTGFQATYAFVALSRVSASVLHAPMQIVIESGIYSNWIAFLNALEYMSLNRKAQQGTQEFTNQSLNSNIVTCFYMHLSGMAFSLTALLIEIALSPNLVRRQMSAFVDFVRQNVCVVSLCKAHKPLPLQRIMVSPADFPYSYLP